MRWWSPFIVPDVAPGIYTIVVIDEDGGGAGMTGHAEFQVTH